MRYRLFGRGLGLRVSELALGTGMFGTRWDYGSDPDVSGRILDRSLDAGGTFIDTADTDQFGESEENVGALLGAKRNRIVLATKFTMAADKDNPLVAIERETP